MNGHPRDSISTDLEAGRPTISAHGDALARRVMALIVEPLLRAGCTHELDAGRPLDEVVADLIAIASGDMRHR